MHLTRKIKSLFKTNKVKIPSDDTKRAVAEMVYNRVEPASLSIPDKVIKPLNGRVT